MAGERTFTWADGENAVEALLANAQANVELLEQAGGGGEDLRRWKEQGEGVRKLLKDMRAAGPE